MDFLNVNYKFENKDNQCFMFKITEEDGKYFSKADITDAEGKNTERKMEVFITNGNFVESGEINVEEENQKQMVVVDKEIVCFKLKCKFKGRKLSPVSNMLVLHKGFKHWVTYPFDMVGTMTEY